ncbi:hypothetical protein HK098_005043 [Nowakowskiella sp. JEL0407]|nr:hypothetical protein HK098_005043 [Nowakowskiella sp. JEL0407]
MTPIYLKHLCKEQKLYQTPSLNDRLYLHFKGFVKIEGLDEYTGLRTLWLEGNGINEISGLDSQLELRCLFMQQNCIQTISNLSHLEFLDTLNLSNNLIKKIDVGALSALKNMKTLQLAHNFLRAKDDLKGLTDCPSISILDLSHNKLEDPEILDTLRNLPNLAVLNLMSNTVISKIENYRKTFISNIKSLTYLDDRPVFDNERLATEAWARGGIEAEREERNRQREEQRVEQNRNFEALRRLQEEARQCRIETFGPDTEPVFSVPLTKFRDEQLGKIAESAEPVSELSHAAKDIVETKAENESLNVRTTISPKDTVINNVISTSSTVPVRGFAELDVTGKILSVEKPEQNDSQPVEKIKIPGVSTPPSKPLISELNDVPELETMTNAVENLSLGTDDIDSADQPDPNWISLIKSATKADDEAREKLENSESSVTMERLFRTTGTVKPCSSTKANRPLIVEVEEEMEIIETPLSKINNARSKVLANRKIIEEVEAGDKEEIFKFDEEALGTGMKSDHREIIIEEVEENEEINV